MESLPGYDVWKLASPYDEPELHEEADEDGEGHYSPEPYDVENDR